MRRTMCNEKEVLEEIQTLNNVIQNDRKNMIPKEHMIAKELTHQNQNKLGDYTHNPDVIHPTKDSCS